VDAYPNQTTHATAIMAVMRVLRFEVEDPADPTGAGAPEGERLRAIWCAACAAALCDHDDRVEVSGASTHTFVNPAGIVFEILCVTEAAVHEVSPRQSVFSWFPGYVWAVCACAACRVHLGWRFTGGGPAFVGLIRERIVE
jgi:hypothetical protein